MTPDPHAHPVPHQSKSNPRNREDSGGFSCAPNGFEPATFGAGKERCPIVTVIGVQCIEVVLHGVMTHAAAFANDQRTFPDLTEGIQIAAADGVDEFGNGASAMIGGMKIDRC